MVEYEDLGVAPRSSYIWGDDPSLVPPKGLGPSRADEGDPPSGTATNRVEQSDGGRVRSDYA
jgi:hypothetical protein